MRWTAWVRCVVVAVISMVGSNRSAVAIQSEQAAAAALEPAIKALEFLQIDYQIAPDRSYLWFSVPRSMDGVRANMALEPLSLGADQSRWFRLFAPNIHDIDDDAHPAVTRRALIEAGKMLGTDVQFVARGLGGAVDARVLIPVQDGKLASKVLESSIGLIVDSLDRVQPVLARAGTVGQIDWPSLDRGPRQPTGELRVPSSDGRDPLVVPWAPWIEGHVYASSIITLDAASRNLLGYDANQMEQSVKMHIGPGEAGSLVADHLKQTYPPIKFRFWGPPGTTVTARATIEGFAPEATASGMIDAMYYCDVRITPDWDAEALASLTDPRRATVRFTVESGGQRASGTQDITIEPSSVADLGLRQIAVAQYVNEDHPWVRTIISDANGLGIAPSLGFTGSEGYMECARQIYAVWVAFRNRGISYVSLAENASTSSDSTQSIRQFHEAIIERGANCADGAAAFASVLRKLNYDVYLLCTKSHVFVGVHFPEQDARNQWLFVETTGLGEVEPGPPPPDHPLTRLVMQIPKPYQGENLDTFIIACIQGEDQLDGVTSIAHVEALRSFGMRPLPVPRKDLGRLPAPPAGVEASREALRASKRAMKRVFDYLTGAIRAPGCAPYESEQQIWRDIDALERDPVARRRLLAAVDGSGDLVNLARVRAELDEILEPAIASAMSKFGSIPGWGAEWLGVVGSPWDIEIERDGESGESVMFKVIPEDRISPRSWVEAQQRLGRWVISERSIVDSVESRLAVLVLNIASRDDRTGLERFAEDLKGRVDSGKIPSVAAFLEQYHEGLAGLCPSELQLQELADRASGTGVGSGPRSGQRVPPSSPIAGSTGQPPRVRATPSAHSVRSVVTNDVKMGAGPSAQSGDEVEVHYICRLSDGTLIFDSKARDGKVRRYVAGGKSIPTGVGVALIGVREGGVRTAVIPPELAYGAEGRPASNIPPNAELHYEFTVVKVSGR